MTDPRKPSPILPIAVTLAVLLGLYVGAYYWLLNIEWYADLYRVPYYALSTRQFEGHSGSRDPLGRFFAPAHWLDRRIRSHVWEPSE